MADDFLVRDTRLPGHFWADNEVLDIYGPLLGAHGLAVYMALCRVAINGTGECKISKQAIADKLGISKGGAFNALNLIVKLGLARELQKGDARQTAVYVLADVKSLCNPEMAQMKLGSVHGMNAKPSSSVHTVNAEPIGVHGVNSNGHPVNAKVHTVNAAFTRRPRNKEDNTSSRLKTNKTVPCPKCNNTGSYPHKGHPGMEIFCHCAIGQAEQKKYHQSGVAQ